MTLRRLLGRPSWSILAGVVPLILVAAILGIVAILPIDPKQMAYVGIAYMLFFPILFLFAIGTAGSLAAIWLTVRGDRGLIWPVIALVLNLGPLWMMGSHPLLH
ncbi:MAG: hypothetical protein DMF58_08880 [Acidobacteria bacterium]|nr:MAG: hypothetical protein DMF58_08880 [Acidobacteriota bacterium]